MKKFLFGALALLIAAGTTSCGSSKKSASSPSGMVREEIPMSGPQFQTDAEYFRATQNGASTDRSIAQKLAMQNCRQELASAIQQQLQTVIENYAKNEDTGLSTVAKSLYQELSYTVVNQQLRDVQVVDQELYRQEDGLYRYYVCLQMPKASIEEAMADALANDAKLNLEFDRAQFKEVFHQQMEAFSQQR